MKVPSWILPDPHADGDEPDVRFSYANERTFLAWNRTALALIGVGLAVAGLLPDFNVPGGRQIVALPLVALGGFVAVVSLREWGANERAMRQGRALPRSRLPVLLSIVIALVAAAAVIVTAFGKNG